MVSELCNAISERNKIAPALYEKYGVKRGLRNSDGTGVTAGITNICNVHGYIVNEGEKTPIEGELYYRGININDIVENTTAKRRNGFEETAYLLLFGTLPSAAELDRFSGLIEHFRKLPTGFSEDMIFKAPSRNIMNKMGRAVSALYSYDENPEDQSLEKELLRAISVISRLPAVMADSYQVKKRIFDNESLFMHPLIEGERTAQSILSALRPDRLYSEEESLLLDLCLMLHAEHGGGNNSTFVCRCLTSTGTDAYAAYSGAIGSLKGPRHGGANAKVMAQLAEMNENLKSKDDAAVADYIAKILKKQAGDGSGLVYGMGHAVYTKSDPRSVLLKKYAIKLAAGKDEEADFKLLDAVERLTPSIFAEIHGSDKAMCANVDMYSGLVYKMLKIPPELYTPLFAVSRITGWAAHRIEEMLTCKRIMRPGYKAIGKVSPYIPLEDRG
ncbi:MAG: citrate synthase [Ruminococcus sp.]|nr:citrate synthase [Ruminococcus sp.]